MEKLEIRAVIKYFCKKGMPKEINEDSWKSLGRSIFSTVQPKNWQQCLRRGECIEDDGRSGRYEYATADINAKGVHTLQSKASKGSGHTFRGSTINPKGHLRYVKIFRPDGCREC